MSGQPEMYSLYDPAAHDRWFAVERYYAMQYTVYEMRMHEHPQMEIMYVSDGRCKVALSDTEYTLREGDYILLDSGVPHRLIVERGVPCRVLNMEARLCRSDSPVRVELLRQSEKYDRFHRAALPAFVGEDGDGILYDGLVNLLRLLEQAADAVEIDIQLASLLLETGRQFADRRGRRTKGIPAYIKRAMDYIGEQFDQDISIDAIAEAAGVSRSHLQRTFHQHVGCPITAKINELRMEKAKYLLDTSTIPIVDIAGSVGFDSRQHFSSLFTRLTGCTPAEYRKRKGNQTVSRGHGRL
ncbi:AraC family transcriptional regulator [Ruminococcaceae bacterium OttesenSCG-928-L11]|nr:AraC family transcriptional regulator [Ruminococcaceae bacterium OttesenSCG-928-L11]